MAIPDHTTVTHGHTTGDHAMVMDIEDTDGMAIKGIIDTEDINTNHQEESKRRTVKNAECYREM